jgi:iron(III) transport system substrate-binding protein
MHSKSAAVVIALSLPVLLATAMAGGCTQTTTNEVVVYTSVDQVYAEPVLKDFETQTGIKVRAVYDAEAAKTTGLVNRLLAEKSRPRADVWWSGEIVQTLRLAEQDVLGEYRSPSAKAIPVNLQDPSGLWTGFGGRARVLLVNGASTVPAPTSIKDLEWRTGASDIAPGPANRAAMSNPVFGTAATQAAILYSLWGPEEAKAYYQTIAGAGVSVLEGNGDVRDKVVSGELDWGLTDTDDALGAVEKGANVRIVVPDQDAGGLGAVLIPNTVGLVAGAPNPDTGKQLIDYLLSDSTEQRLVKDSWIQFPVRGAPDVRVSKTPVRFMEVDWMKAYAQLESSAKDMKEIFLK